MNSYTPTPPEASQQSLRDRYTNLVITFLVAPALLIASILILNIVEHQVDVAKLAKKAPRFLANHITPEAEQFPLVAITGRVSFNHLLGDKAHLLPGEYLQYTRKTEVYAWVENHKPQHTHDAQGRNIVQPGLTYTPMWTQDPTPSENFIEPEGHQNPLLEFKATPRNIHSFKLGKYTVESAKLQLPPPEMLELTPDTVAIHPGESIAHNVIYKPKHPHTNLETPLIGDIKTSYAVVAGAGRTATILGRITGEAITMVCMPKGTSADPDETFQRLFWGTPEEALATLEAEGTPPTFLGRTLAFILMFFGFFAFLRPMKTRFGFLPVTQQPSYLLRALITLIFFGECVFLLNIIANPWYVIATSALMLSAILSWLRKNTL